MDLGPVEIALVHPVQAHAVHEPQPPAHGYDELSMARIAKASGVSKPLLYHYFPTKRQLFEAVLAQAAEQLTGSLDAYLQWIDANAETYENLLRSAGIPEVRELIDRVREETARRILEGLAAEGGAPPQVRAAVRGWLWFMDGVCLDWVRERDLHRDEVHGLLLGSLFGALNAAGYDPAPLMTHG